MLSHLTFPYNNPLSYTDPTGYEPDYAQGDDGLGNKRNTDRDGKSDWENDRDRINDRIKAERDRREKAAAEDAARKAEQERLAALAAAEEEKRKADEAAKKAELDKQKKADEEDKPKAEPELPETMTKKDDTVNITNLSDKMRDSLGIIADVVSRLGLPDPVITSGNDSRHKKYSKHYDDRAIDIRGKNLSDDTQDDLADAIQDSLGDDYNVLSEHYKNNENNDHIHIDDGGSPRKNGKAGRLYK